MKQIIVKGYISISLLVLISSHQIEIQYSRYFTHFYLGQYKKYDIIIKHLQRIAQWHSFFLFKLS